MKKLFILLGAAAVLLTAACSKPNEGKKAADKADMAELSINLSGGVLTKATGNYDSKEFTINNVQVFCFDVATGVLDYATKNLSQAAQTTTDLKLNTTKGTKHIYALVNCRDLSDIASESALLSAVTNFDSNSIDSGFEMVSPTDPVPTYTITGNQAIEIPVKRIVAKIIVGRLEASFEQVSIRSVDFIIEKIYLTNVAASNNYGLTATPSAYYDGSDTDLASSHPSVPGMIAETGLSYNLKNSGSSEVAHGFYVYPNSSVNQTSVVVVGSLNGAAQVYSFPIKMAIERNKVYSIERIKFKNPASDDVFADLDLTITVQDWDETVTMVDTDFEY